jgi:hypothetical protein
MKTLDEAAIEYARNHSNAPDKETPDWIITDFKAGAEYAAEQNAELKRKITRIIESYERELKAWENMETNDLNRGFVDWNKRAINAMLIELKTIKH